MQNRSVASAEDGTSLLRGNVAALRALMELHPIQLMAAAKRPVGALPPDDRPSQMSTTPHFGGRGGQVSQNEVAAGRAALAKHATVLRQKQENISTTLVEAEEVRGLLPASEPRCTRNSNSKFSMNVIESFATDCNAFASNKGIIGRTRKQSGSLTPRNISCLSSPKLKTYLLSALNVWVSKSFHKRSATCICRPC